MKRGRRRERRRIEETTEAVAGLDLESYLSVPVSERETERERERERDRERERGVPGVAPK